MSKRRFEDVVGKMSKGPTRDRLSAMEGRLEEGIDESWRIARRGHDITQALKGLSTKDAESDLAEITVTLEPGTAPTDSQTALIDALQAQIDAARRLSTTSTAAMEKLRVLDARFSELVARAIEVSVGAGDSEMLGNDVDGLVTELEALRSAIEETTATEAAVLPIEIPQTLPSPGTTSPPQ